MKDNDFIKQGIKVKIGAEKKQKLIEILNSDVEFLTKLHLMDYSLLIGIHDCQAAEDAAEGGNKSDGNRSENDRSDEDEMWVTVLLESLNS